MKQKLATKTSGAELFSRFGILLIFAVVVIAAALVSDRFLAPDNIISVFTQCTVIGVLSCGMTMLIVSGNTDLSAGSGVALAGVVCALVINSTGSWILAGDGSHYAADKCYPGRIGLLFCDCRIHRDPCGPACFPRCGTGDLWRCSDHRCGCDCQNLQ